MIFEMHSHTAEHSSCSQVDAADLVRRAFEKGLQGIVLTDHHYRWPAEELAELRRRAQVPKYFVLFSGQEVTTADFGDVLVYGADRTIPRGTPLGHIRRDHPRAALVWAHPYREEKMPAGELLLDPRLDAVEIFNSNHTHLENARGLRDWHRFRFTAVAGTDTHALSYTGTFPTLFDHPVESVDDLAAEIRHGHCRPFFKEIPREGSNLQITELTLGPGNGGGEEKLIIKTLETPQWESAEGSFRIMAELARHGFESGPYRVPRPLSRDAGTLTLVEEGIVGRSLFDQLVTAEAPIARASLQMAARWLARLHNCRLRITSPGGYLERERSHLEKCLSAFTEARHRQTRRAREIVETILQLERELIARNPDQLVQGHGDFNPRNILVGYDVPENPESRFIAAIDFDSSSCIPPSLDVGTFVAQFRNQFFHHGEVLRKVSEKDFLDAYLEAAEGYGADFLAQVELFRARANIDISYYLLKVGLGGSENLWRVLVESDQALARLAVHGSMG